MSLVYLDEQMDRISSHFISFFISLLVFAIGQYVHIPILLD